MNVNQIVIQCIFKNARDRMTEADTIQEQQAIMEGLSQEIEAIEDQNLPNDRRAKLIEIFELGAQKQKTIWEILDAMELTILNTMEVPKKLLELN